MTQSIEEEFRFDVRIQERMVKKGLVEKEELQKRLEALADLENESELLELEQPGLTRLDADSETENKEAP